MLPHLLSPVSAHCAACGCLSGVLGGLPLCAGCARQLLRAQQSFEALCPRCLSVSVPGRPCPVCKRDPGHLITRTFAPYRYRGVVRGLVLRLKFSGDTQAAALLAPAMAKVLREAEADLLMPVPLGPRRERERGYNQSGLLAMLVGHLRGIPMGEELIRVRDTKRQSGIHSILERSRNMDGAFSMRSGANVRNRRILLVDDVRTSGATALACARVLREAGAADVSLLCAAIAPGAGRYFTGAKKTRGIFRRKDR